MNLQHPEKRVTGDGVTLAVNSLFYTIQGEGPYAGRPAVFIRLAGCNLQCPLCDTEYTNRDSYAVSELVDMAFNHVRSLSRTDRAGRAEDPIIVITGGEPFRQPIGYLVRCLVDAGWRVQVETNGTLYQEGPWTDPHVAIVCSPKAGQVHPYLVPHVTAWKYVACADRLAHDGLPTSALEHPNARGLYRPPDGHPAPIYLQPADEQDAAVNERNAQAVVHSCMQHGYRLCLQVHKIVNIP